MTKEEFLKKLEQKLMVINDDERADMLLEYQQHIDMKMANGLSEEQAIEDFGDIDELVKDILEAYHINTAYDSSSGFRLKLNYYIQSFTNFLTGFTTALFEKDKHELGQIFIKFLGLMVFLLAFRFLLELGGGVFNSIINILPNLFSVPLYHLINFVISILHLVISVYLIVFFAKKYILIDYQPLDPPATANTAVHEPFVNSETFSTVKQKTTEFKERVLTEENTANFGDLCVRILELSFKFLVILILIPAAIALLCLLITCGALLVFVLQGYGFIGITMIIFGCTLVGFVCFAGISNFVFGGGHKQ